MAINNIFEGILERESYIHPISIGVTEKDKDRWRKLKERMKHINKKLKISVLARKELIRMMDEVEKLVCQYESGEKRFDANDPILPTGKAG
jgi:hypothetical protein